MATLAQVYVEKTVYHFDKPYSYLVASDESKPLCGCRVVVPFGGGNRTRQGVVVATETVATLPPKIKPILKVLDESSLLNDEAFRIIHFLVEHTFCTFYDAVKVLLPAAYNVQIQEEFQCADGVLPTMATDTTAQLVLTFLQTTKTRQQLDRFLKEKVIPSSVLQQLQQDGFVLCRAQTKRKRGDDTVRMVRLEADPFALSLTPKQQEVVEFLCSADQATVEETLYFCAVGEGVLKTLEKKGVLSYYRREVLGKTARAELASQNIATLRLNDTQQQAFDAICEKMSVAQPAVCLLHGVTGSGKTAVFLKLMEQTLQNKKQVLVLVPEISLTPQMTKQFFAYFGERVAVIHSGLSLGERLDAYKQIKAGAIDIVVGTRSAVFAPLDRIGLLILDEEGESSYKSDAAPRYHAREVAKLRAVHHHAVVLLASATPSIESYYKAIKGIYSLVTLPTRYSDRGLPQVHLVDMLQEEKAANQSAVSRILQKEIQKNLDKREQTILLINRRGYRTVACCLQCDTVLQCEQCDVALTYHRDNGYMMCHHCGYAVKFDATCKSCGSTHMKLSGVGTQSIEDELATLFPTAKVLRMDTDTTGSKHAHVEKFSAFSEGAYGILVGTQMVAKGLDFKNVTLVGVLQADSGLNSNDYRGVERVFSLITQVVGRSGRAEKLGRAYIQTYLPDHPIINFAAHQDYEGFYHDEIAARKALGYPPFCDLCLLQMSSVEKKKVEGAADALMHLLQLQAQNSKDGLALRVYGPLQPAVQRLHGKHRLQILIKCKMNRSFRQYMSTVLTLAGKDPAFRSVQLFCDVNGECG